MNLETNCLLCRAAVENFVNDGLFVAWMEYVAASLCQILGLEKYFQQFLQTAVYCDACLFTIRDIDFTLQNVNALQQRLENSRLRISTLLEVNYDEVGSGQTETILGPSDGDDIEEESCSYEKVVTSIWTAMSADKKPDLNEINSRYSLENAVSMRSTSTRNASSRQRHKIVLSELHGTRDSDSDFNTAIEPLVKIDTDAPVPRKRNRKNPTPLKVSKANLAQRKRGREALQKKTSKFVCKSAKCSFATGDSVKYAKHLKLHKTKARKREKKSQEESTDQEDNPDKEVSDTVVKKRRKTNKPRKLGTTKKYSTIKNFNCTVDDCKFRCDNEGRFQVHCRIHEGDEKPYHCDLCKEAKYATNTGLYNHKRQSCSANPDRLYKNNAVRTPRPRVDSETGEDDSAEENPAHEKTELSCSYESCVFSTLSERRYQCHIRVHEGDPLPYWCNSCDKKFPKAKHLNLHKRRNCGDVLTCPISSCTAVFPNPYVIKAHLSAVHGKEGKFACQHCSKMFESIEEAQFKEHELTHETREAEGRKFACIIGDCASKFTNSVDLRSHVLLEHEDSSSKCEVCQAVLANPTSLKRHMQEQHGPPNYSLQCDKCPHIAKHPSGLRLHMNKHSEIKRYACTVEGCGKEFTWPNGLRTHMVSHTGQKKYKCTFENCVKAFVSSSKLRDHEETHSDRHSYFCDRCAKSFKAKKNLKQHFRYVHNVGYTSVKSARRQRLAEGAEDGLDEDFPGPSTVQKPRSKRRSQPVPKIAMAKCSLEQEESEGEEMNEGGSSGRSEVDATLGSGGWSYPHPQHYSGAHAHAQQFLNPLFHQMTNSSLYFNN